MSSASLTLITRIAAFGFSLVTNIILARALGPEGRGVYAVAVLIPAILSLLIQLGIGPANVYYYSKGLIALDELIGHSMSLAFLLGIACLAVVLAYIKLFAGATFLGIGSEYVVVACIGLPFVLLTIFIMGLLQGAQRFVQFNVLLLFQYVLPAVTLIAGVLLFHRTTLTAVWAWTVSTALTAGIAVYCVAPLPRFVFRLRPATLRSLLRFGLISYLGTVTSFVNYRFDVLIVNAFAGARQVGLYSVGTGLAEIVWYISNAASIVLAPRVASSEREQADRITESVGRVVAFLTLVAAIALALLAPFIVVGFFGSAFSDSRWAVWLLLPGIVTFAVGRILSMYLLGRNKLKVDLAAASTGMVVTLALDLFLIPRLGFRGAAIASSIAYTAAMAVDLFWVLRHSSITAAALLIPRRSDATVIWARIRSAGLPGLLGIGRAPRPQV
ncbi:MAG TPA: oligosaccharide flippase family protein [Chloroflexota bacterium]